MKLFSHPIAILISRLYIFGALAVSALISPPALSIGVGLLLLGYLFFWWRHGKNYNFLFLEYFLYYMIAVLFAQRLPVYVAPVVSLPLLLALSHDLGESARIVVPENLATKYKPTRLGLAVALITSASLILGIIINSLTLMISSLVIVVLLTIYILIFTRSFSSPTIRVEKSTLNIIAGSANIFTLKPELVKKIGAQFQLFSPYEWVRIHDPQLFTDQLPLNTELTFTPPLSGPVKVDFKGTMIDQKGLLQASFQLESYALNIIPRARYAEWLAKKYLAETKTGSLPLISNVSNIKPVLGLRSGIEYYGSQLYQPGDSLKNIDWKHSLKYNELISKEFTEFHGQKALLLVNLVANNEDEADKQVFNILTSALSLVKEQVPTALATYNEEESLLVTRTLSPQQLITQCVKLIKDIKISPAPRKYLGKPDVRRLRSNISRLHYVNYPQHQKLRELLEIEYNNLKSIAQNSPVSLTLRKAFQQTEKQVTVVIVSRLNHDVEALEFNRMMLENQGGAAILVQ